MNWGDNLTMIGAMRVDRWLTFGTCWGAINREGFVELADDRRHIAPGGHRRDG